MPVTSRSDGTFLSNRSDYRSTAEAVHLRKVGGGSQGGPSMTPPAPAPEEVEATPKHYQCSHDDEIGFWSKVAGAWVFGFLATVGLFLALPFFQLIATVGNQMTEITTLDLSKPPPPPPPAEKAPPPEKEEKKDQPELKQEQPRLSLAQLELALNPGMGDASAGGDFSMSDFQVNAMEELEFIFDISEVDRIPQPIYRVAPVFPYEMKQAGVSGSVEVLFVCGADGKVKRVSVKSSTHREFEDSAIRAIREWRFEPGMKDGSPVNVRMLIPFNFNVRN
jgi:protein TonB